MKNFRNKLLGILLAAGAICFVVSCSMSELDPPVAVYDFGVITYIYEDDSFEITCDYNGDVYIVTEVAKGNYQTGLGKRVYFGFLLSNCREFRDGKPHSNLGDKAKVYEVKLDEFMYVLSKPIVTESYIMRDEEVRRRETGVDGIRVRIPSDVWFGGDYINIRFEYLRYETAVRHEVNLVWDDLDEKDRANGSASLYLRHNAFGEVPKGSVSEMMSDTGICSFRLTDIVPKERGNVDVTLHWEWYQANGTLVEEELHIGTFTPMGYDNEMGSNTENDDNRYFSPFKRPAIRVE